MLPRPRLWVSLVPYGIGRTKPNHYFEILRTVWDNRHDLPYAWRILSKGVCDGCALGVAGFRDWTMEGVHLCTTRLNLLRVNTMGALDPGLLADVAPLRRVSKEHRLEARGPVGRHGESGVVLADHRLQLLGPGKCGTAPRFEHPAHIGG